MLAENHISRRVAAPARGDSERGIKNQYSVVVGICDKEIARAVAGQAYGPAQRVRTYLARAVVSCCEATSLSKNQMRRLAGGGSA